MKDRVFEYMQRFPDSYPRESLHGWRSAPDEGDHTHCMNCCETIYIGDPVVGTYLKYISVVFCRVCVDDNRGLLWDWLGSDPMADLVD